MAFSPKLIGKYEILEELGRGGFAVVYKARDVELDRLVALKILRPALSDDPGFVARFKQEARAAARLKHPHIVTVYDAAQIDERLIIAMQYVEGRTLRDELQEQGLLPLDRTLTILEQIADALDYAHPRGVVHRDVKPANILLEETTQGVHATLLDFGLAKAMEASTALTSQGTLLGSPEYMAPEQADPNRANEIGPATDRYALGIVAYQLLTGRVPFPGNTPATLNAHLNLKPADPRTFRSEVSPQVSAALRKMLAKVPADRYASAKEFVQALRLSEQPPIHPIGARSSRRLQMALIGFVAALVIGIIGLVVGRQLIQPLTTGSLQRRAKDDMIMVYVPAGTFKMGSDSTDREKPVHDVTLDAFWIDRTEVTNAEYAKCVAAGRCVAPSSTKSDTRDSYYGNSQYDDYPVIYVSWNDADQYCKWAGGQLPTEAQWEYAAHRSQYYDYPWGNTFDGTRSNFCDKNCPFDWANKAVDDGYADTAPVGNYPSGASWVGALDVAGNVWEWVQDWYGSYSATSQTNPAGPDSGDQRVLRGGSWRSVRSNVGVTSRYDGVPDDGDVDQGFRCVLRFP